MSISVIARLTFREASRRWVLWAALLLGVLFLAVYAIGLNEMEKDIRRQMTAPTERLVANAIHGFLLMAGLYVVNFLTVIMTVLTTVDTLSGEIASGTIHTLVSKPLRRWEILFGKWLGFYAMLTCYLLLMGGGVMVVAYLTLGYGTPNALVGLAIMWLNVALLLSVSFFGGSFLSTIANGVLVFGLYGVAFIGGWIEQIGSFLNNQTAVNIGIISSLLIPSEALWRRATYAMQSPGMSGISNFSPFSSNSVPSPLMIVYALVYLGVVLALAIRRFSRRDL